MPLAHFFSKHRATIRRRTVRGKKRTKRKHRTTMSWVNEETEESVNKKNTTTLYVCFVIWNLFDNKETVFSIAHGYKFNFIFVPSNLVHLVLRFSQNCPLAIELRLRLFRHSRAFSSHFFSLVFVFVSLYYGLKNIFSWHTVYFPIDSFRNRLIFPRFWRH